MARNALRRNDTDVFPQVDSAAITKWRGRQCANTDGHYPAISTAPRKQGI